MAVRPLPAHTMHDIRLIALDLDGTLLNSDKELSSRNRKALYSAAEQGIEIVPTTGRFFSAIPEAIRNLPFLHYAITINGAQVYDIVNDLVISATEIPCQRAMNIMTYLDTLPVIYDCYMRNWGWMTRSMWEKADEFAPDAHYAKMIHDLRQPVDELKAFIAQEGYDIQKIQLFCKDIDLHRDLLQKLPERWPDFAVSSAVSNNIELNHRDANKGQALMQLATHLNLDITQTAAFGDGLNDITMLQQAGIGIAMSNSTPEVLRMADEVTADCDHDGVAQFIESYIL